MSDLPRVSAIVAVHNGAAFLREALDSLLAETYPNLEVLVYDDVSADETPEIITEYAAKDPRIRTYRGDEKAPTLAVIHRFLVSESSGAYFIVSDGDDVFLPHRISRLVEAIRGRPDASVAFGKSRIVGEDKATVFGVLGRPALPLTYFMSNCMSNGASLISRDHYERCGGLDEGIGWAEDYELRLRLFLEGPFVFVDHVVLLSRMHGASMTATLGSAEKERAVKQALLERTASLVERCRARNGAGADHRERVAVQYAAADLAYYRKRPYDAYRFLRALLDTAGDGLPSARRLQLRLSQFRRRCGKRTRRILGEYAARLVGV